MTTKLHQLSADEALRSLGSSPSGLTKIEADRRLHEFGPNRIEPVARRSLALDFLGEFTHFFAVILWIAAGLAIVADVFDPGQGFRTLAWAIVGVIVVNASFSFWQEYRAERALDELQKLLPKTANVRRDGFTTRIPAEELVPGDLLVLEAGDDVPADARLIEAAAVRVNTATLTGESIPASRDALPGENGDPLRISNVVLAGTSFATGRGTALVFATGMQTEFGHIAHLTQSAGEAASPLQVEIRRVSRAVAVLATVLGLVFFALGRILGLPFWANFLFAIGIIVANVPEGLLPAVTLALAMASQRMARRNALVRHLASVETLGSATVICTDKTGTLTLNEMTARRVCLSGEWVDTDSHAWRDEHCELRTRLLETSAACEDAEEGDQADGGPRRATGDPMELALLRLVRESGVARPTDGWVRLAEAPFEASRRRMSVLHRTPDGIRLYCKGAPEVILARCDTVLTRRGCEPLDPTGRARFVAAQEMAAESGLRVLAFAFRKVPGDPTDDIEGLEREMTLCGLVALEDPPRPEVPAAVSRCREAGIKVVMVTGDHPRTAEAIARRIGLIADGETSRVITGDELARMSVVQLQLALDTPEILFARVTAEQKMLIVRALKRKRHIVAATGDGVNDAPALKEAHIGVAMGLGGTDVAREAADIVLLDDNFASIVAAVEEGRAVFANIRKFLTYILTSNVPELVPYLAFVLFRVPLALTVIQVLAVDLGTDMLPAMALGAQPPEPGVMQVPPRPAHQRLFDTPLLLRAYGFLGVLEAGVAMAAFFFVLHGGGWTYGQRLAGDSPLYRQATTACLIAIVLSQVANVFVCRSDLRSVFRSGRRGLGLILIGIAAEFGLILAITYSRPGQILVGTAPVGLSVWLFVVPLAAAMIALEELRKWVARRLFDDRRRACGSNGIAPRPLARSLDRNLITKGGAIDSTPTRP
jgi:calcium-translocating P-type ATPase